MKLFNDDFESLGQYHDMWSTVIMNAPDDFHSFDDTPIDQAQALEDAFSALRSGFRLVERKVKDERARRIMRELIEMSYEAFRAGDSKIGAHTLQECEGMIWPSRAQRVKYAVAAEKRAFGDIHTYRDVKISPYPYEGTEDDMRAGMRILYAAAQSRYLDHFSKQEDFKPYILLLHADESVRELKARSWKAAKQEIRTLAANGQTNAYARVEVVVSGMSGVLICDLEEIGSPHISIRCLVKDYVCEAPHFHLDAPNVLSLDA